MPTHPRPADGGRHVPAHLCRPGGQDGNGADLVRPCAHSLSAGRIHVGLNHQLVDGLVDNRRYHRSGDDRGGATAAPATGALAFTGSGPDTWYTLLAALVMLSLGFLLLSVYYRPRELAAKIRHGVGRTIGVEGVALTTPTSLKGAQVVSARKRPGPLAFVLGASPLDDPSDPCASSAHLGVARHSTPGRS